MSRQSRQVTYFLGVNVSNTDRRPLDWLQERWGSTVHHNARTGNLSDYYVWQLHGAKAARFLGDIRPYLQIKGPNADNALEFLAFKAQYEGRGQRPTPPEIVAEQKRYYIRARELIPRRRRGN